MKRTQKEILDHLQAAIAAGTYVVESGEGFRYYRNVLDPAVPNIPLTTPKDVAEMYERLVMDGGAVSNAALPGSNTFDLLPRVSLYVGQPDTGKTYKAIQIAEQAGLVPLIKMCRDNLNLETLLEDFILVDGKPIFNESVALKMMSDPNQAKGIIVFDEFNTLLTGVMKTLQPIFDETSKTFEYRGKVYQKNLNCKFIVTLNDKDKGISVVPDAILSRSRLTWFEAPTINTLSQWTGVPAAWIKNLQDVYKALNMSNIFGSRQIKMLHNSSIQDIRNHLYGLCMMRNINSNALDTIELKNAMNKLI